MDWKKELVKMALEERNKAYAPYSKFRVGASVMMENGKVYTGVNVENASFGATICAERTAIVKAVSDGELKIKAVAVASDSREQTFPCGICLQVILEFGHDDTLVLCSNNMGDFKEYKLKELMPYYFKFQEARD
ncbi:MAG: cytidine deaminase [Clostridiaceae bacterium]|nr:cytidine deaminase [Clostridiaceae bacterium]